jgi:hypothetical protein
MRLRRLFTDHPKSVGETYVEHFRAAISFAVRLLAGGAACLVHAVFPFLFKSTGSGFVRELHGRMVINRSRVVAHDRVRDESSGT